ncbi:MAG: hypothetical protein AAF800_09480 [Planctomycetota bacterium]
MSDSPEFSQDGFAWTIGLAVEDAAGEHDALVHLAWRCDGEPPATVQVYVNDELADWIDDPDQHECWLTLDRTRPQRVELLAVRPGGQIDVAVPEALGGWQPRIADRLTATLLRDESLPPDTRVSVSVDGEAVASGPMWPADEPRSGFGGLFGVGGFGRDDAAGPGLGRGDLGLGPLGADGSPWRWVRHEVTPGTRTVTLAAADANGRPVAPPLTAAPQATDTPPAPARGLRAAADFTLTWTD